MNNRSLPHTPGVKTPNLGMTQQNFMPGGGTSEKERLMMTTAAAGMTRLKEQFHTSKFVCLTSSRLQTFLRHGFSFHKIHKQT